MNPEEVCKGLGLESPRFRHAPLFSWQTTEITCAMPMLLLLLCLGLLCAEEDARFEIYALGLSYHSQKQDSKGKDFTGLNPGVGVGVRGTGDVLNPYAGLVGFRDSYKYATVMASVGASYAPWDWCCVDLGASLQASHARIRGGACWSLGVQVLPNLWVHGSMLPRWVLGDTAVVYGYLRYTL